VDPNRLRAGLELLEKRYRVRCSEGLLTRTGYLAGDDERRAAELNGYLRDSEVRAVFVARGGYGVMRILDALDATALAADPIAVVGFSDATALLNWAIAAAHVAAVHGPVVSQFADLPGTDIDKLWQLLESPVVVPQIIGAEQHVVAAVPPGTRAGMRMQGRLVGGNLCVLSHLVGTRYMPELDGALLLLEDVGERSYAIDRYITHLDLAGVLERVDGVLLGDFVRCGETADSVQTDVVALARERLSDLGARVISGIPIGHGSRNLSVWVGVESLVDSRPR